MLVSENEKLLSRFPGVRKQMFLDVALSVGFGRPVLDLQKFDGLLHGVFGEYEEEQGLSMQGLLEREFGDEFALFVRGLL
jgi:hypothetical protein